MTKQAMSSEHVVSEYLASFDVRGMRLDLEPLRRILARLGDPHRKMRAVLIAGTNGKGSTAAMVASILAEAGLRVGLYTSPHLVDFRERIRVNGEMISWDALAEIVNGIRGSLDSATTYFEFATIAAFMHFARSRVDVAVLEVGMGGRLDATNVVDPEVSVITNISMEHSRYLGKTLAAIAGEKAGIIRENGLCITASGNARVVSTLESICHDRHAALLRVGKAVKVRKDAAAGTFSYAGLKLRLPHLVLPLKGTHQFRNAATALAAIEVLTQKGFRIDENAVRQGLAKTRWEGRLERLLERPALIVDGAHNPAGVAVLAAALRHDFTYRRLILISGILQDKASRAMLRKLAPLASLLIVTGLDTPRSHTPETLAGLARPYARNIVVRATSEAALDEALKQAGPDDLICAAGSLFLVGEIKKIVSRRGLGNPK